MARAITTSSMLHAPVPAAHREGAARSGQGRLALIVALVLAVTAAAVMLLVAARQAEQIRYMHEARSVSYRGGSRWPVPAPQPDGVVEGVTTTIGDAGFLIVAAGDPDLITAGDGLSYFRREDPLRVLWRVTADYTGAPATLPPSGPQDWRVAASRITRADGATYLLLPLGDPDVVPRGTPEHERGYLIGGWPVLVGSTYIAQAEGDARGVQAIPLGLLAVPSLRRRRQAA